MPRLGQSGIRCDQRPAPAGRSHVPLTRRHNAATLGRMRRTLCTTASAAALLLALAGCGSDDAPAKQPATQSAAPSPSPSDDGGGILSGLPPKPTGAKRQQYLDALKAIDPALVVDPEHAIDDGRNQCQALNGGAKDPNGSAAERFGTDEHTVDQGEAKQINKALRDTLCPK